MADEVAPFICVGKMCVGIVKDVADNDEGLPTFNGIPCAFSNIGTAFLTAKLCTGPITLGGAFNFPPCEMILCC